MEVATTCNGGCNLTHLRELCEARGERTPVVRVREPTCGGVGALQPQRAAQFRAVLVCRTERRDPVRLGVCS